MDVKVHFRSQDIILRQGEEQEICGYDYWVPSTIGNFIFNASFSLRNSGCVLTQSNVKDCVFIYNRIKVIL